MKSRTSISSILGNVLLVFASVLGSLLIAEFGIRLLAPQDLDPHPRGLYSADSELGWTLTPGFSGEDSSPEFEVSLRINSIGIRDKELGPKLPNQQRILILGDSFTYGTGVEWRDAYPHRVQDELRAMGRPGVTVVNGGVPGYGTNRQVVHFDRLVDQVQPDIVLVGFFSGNDLFDNLNLNDAEVIDGYLITKVLGSRAQLTQSLGIPVEFKIWIRTRSHLYGVLMNAWSAMLAKTETTFDENALEVYREDPTDRVASAVETTREILGRFAEECRARGVKLGLVLIPNGWLSPSLDGRPGYRLERPTELIYQVAIDLDIPVIDLSAQLGTIASSGLYFPADGHWTPEGHTVAGRAIATALLDGELVSLLTESPRNPQAGD